MTLLEELQTRTNPEIMAHFDCEATEQEQGRFAENILVYLWFRVEISAWDRRRRLTFLQKGLEDRRRMVKGKTVRVVSQISPERKLMPKDHAIWLDTADKTGLGKELFDIRWVLRSCRFM